MEPSTVPVLAAHHLVSVIDVSPETITWLGVVVDWAGRLGDEGESVTHDGVRLIAETVEHHRILEVRIDVAGMGTKGTDASEGP